MAASIYNLVPPQSWRAVQTNWPRVQDAARTRHVALRDSSCAGGDMIDWSTDSIREAERFSFWREVVCKSMLHVSTESTPEQFSGRMSGRSFGKLRFASFDCTAHELVRTRQQVARMPEDYYVVTLHLQGRSQFSQGDEAIALETNEIAIVDGKRPFHIAFMEPVRRASAVIPHAMID